MTSAMERGRERAKAEHARLAAGLAEVDESGQPESTESPAMQRGRERARALQPDPARQIDPFTGPGFRRVG